MRKKLCYLCLLGSLLFLGSCNRETVSNPSLDISEVSSENEIAALKLKYNCIDISEIREKCKNYSEESKERFYVYGVVKEISNPTYGQMVIEDETGEIDVYGVYSSDGVLSFPQMESRPAVGDEVVLHATLQMYNNSPEIKNGRLIEFISHQKEIDINDYVKMTIAEARTKEKDSLVRLEGVVSKITYANGKVPSGFILVDNTSSIYVYDGNVAAQVSEGNKITVVGKKDFWILADEKTNADKFGYKGCNQIAEAKILENDKGTNDFDKTWIQETTVKDIMDTAFTKDITSLVYKVNALVKKAPGNGFINYYINDLDDFNGLQNASGSYVYTQCNGSDFDWLDEFDGKICTVYLTALNAKSSASGCVWRFLPVKVIDENYQFDTTKTGEHIMKYYVDGLFRKVYTGDPSLEVKTSISSDLLGFENATIAYESDNTSVIRFDNDQTGKVVMHAGAYGDANVTVTVSYGTNAPVTKKIKITVSKVSFGDTITVKEAIDAEPSTTEKLTLRGIAGPSLVNQVGFYLIDETGTIAVKTEETIFSEVELGNEIVIEGYRTKQIKENKPGYGQACITNVTLVANLYGKNDYPTDSFIKGKDLAYLSNLDVNTNQSSQVYVIEASLDKVETKYYSNVYLKDGDVQLLLYTSSGSQYNWASKFMDGKKYTMEVALCNWNGNGNKGVILSITDPTTNEKVINSLYYTK